MNCEIRNSLQGSDVDLLTLRCLRIYGSGPYAGSEVSNAVDLMSWQKLLAEQTEVEPSIRCPSYASVVQVEGVDIDVCLHRQKKAEATLRRPRALSPKRQGDCELIV